MSHKTELLPRNEGESLTDWTLRFLADGRQQLQTAQEVQGEIHPPGPGLDESAFDLERRRMEDLYRACTPVESEYAEGGEE